MSTKKNIRRHKQRKLLSYSKQLLLAIYERADKLTEPLEAITFKHHVYGGQTNYHKSFYSLQRSGYVKKVKRESGRSLFLITKTGILKAKTMIAKEIYDDLKRKKKWDGKWRFVMYDVPVEYNKLRDYLRNTLQYLGFVKLQDSVWVFPYDVFGIIQELVPDIKKHDWIRLIEGEQLFNDKKIWNNFFDKNKPEH